jgi:protein tyrosine/serine phosphatase
VHPRVTAMATELKAKPEAVRAVLRVERSYLEAALQTIERDFQSLDNYRRSKLELSDQDLLRLKARLLEK